MTITASSNAILHQIFGILILLCLMLSCGTFFWESYTGSEFRLYLPWESFVSSKEGLAAFEISLLGFLSYIIILSTLVPISLYVSIEFLRLLQSKWIDWDVQMYYAPSNVPAEVRTTTLNEELGQIEYIFSDKTGTLTQVSMVLFSLLSRKNIGVLHLEYHDL